MTELSRRTLVHGGPVITQNDHREVHEAMVIDGDVVLGTGALDEMRSLAGGAARRFDLQGATVMPGLIDGHPHFIHFASFDIDSLKLYEARNHDDIMALIRARAAVTKPGEWIITTPVGEPHYFIRRSWRNMPEGRLPNRRELDAAAPDHPVWLQAYGPETPNVCAMNSKALEMLGFTRDLPDRIDDLWIDKDQHGELTGIFRGNVNNCYNASLFWLERVAFKLLKATDDLWYRSALDGQRTAASLGVTTAYEGHAMEAAQIAAYQRLRDENRLTMRVMATLEAAPYAFDLGLGLTDDGIRATFQLASELKQVTDPRFRVNGLTVSAGCVAWPGFMRTDFPYKDPYGRLTQGRNFIPPALQREAIDYCLRHDVRLNRGHCSWPDHREFLEWLEPYLDKFDVAKREWVIQHNIFVDDAPLQRYAELNFHLTSSLSFCWGKGAMYAERLGENAIKDLVPIGKMFGTGANVGLGADWGPANRFEHIALAQTREFGATGRRHDGPGYSITRQQALDGWTRNNARLMQWEGIGALQAGFKADFIIVDRNPLTCSLDDLSKTKVLRTVLDGADIFDTKALSRIDP